MGKAQVFGYKKKTKAQLIKAIDECSSLSQIFALIQHESITIQMHSQTSASNIAKKTLSPKEITSNRETPLDRLKREVKKSLK